MSRSWLKDYFGTTRVWLGRDTVCIVGKVSARGKESDDAGTETVLAEEGAGEPVWYASLQALHRLLERQSTSDMPRRLKVILSNEFVRYVLAPWTNEKLSESERRELVRSLLIDRYGERESHWQVIVEPQRFETPSLAAAIDIDLTDAVQSLCAKRKLRLVSLMPALAENLNRQRSVMAQKKAGWFVDAGDGRLAVLAFNAKGWASISNERTDKKPIAETLLPVLRRDSIRAPELLQGSVFIPAACGEMESITQSWPVIRMNDKGLPTCA